MKKYVAYLDILGFKERLRNTKHQDAKEFISDFSSTIFKSWKSHCEYENHLDGFIFSDSFIINTKEVSTDSLRFLLEAIIDVCQNQFLQHGIVLRGGIAKGNYTRLPAKELKNLEKGLIVGQAYIDAYLLEEGVKTIGIVVSKEVYEDIQELASKEDINVKILEEDIGGEKRHVISCFPLDFLNISGNLKKFVSLAVSSGWLPHYYNTLYFSIMNEKPSGANMLFANIIELLNGDSYSESWRIIDSFIKNAFNESVLYNFQTRFLKYIRSRIINDEKDEIAGALHRSKL